MLHSVQTRVKYKIMLSFLSLSGTPSAREKQTFNRKITHYIEFLVIFRDPFCKGKTNFDQKKNTLYRVFSHSPGPPSAREKRTLDKNIFGFEKVPAL